MSMGRNKLTMEKIENPTTRQTTFSKRKDGILKKAKELSILCDTDVALIMFSPTGQVTTFPTNGRVEDVFLRFINRPDELKGGSIWNEKVLEENLYKLKRRQQKAQEKIRYFNPDVASISSVTEAGLYQQFLTSALQRIEESKAKLLFNHIGQQSQLGNHEVANVDMDCADSVLTGMYQMMNTW